MNYQPFLMAAALAVLALVSPTQAQPTSAPPARPATSRLVRVTGPSRVNAQALARQEARRPSPPRARRPLPEVAIPSNFPLPRGVAASSAPAAPGNDPSPTVADAGPDQSPPQAAQSFLALPDDGTVAPPDPAGAVGHDHIVTALNSQIRIQSRNGGPDTVLRLQTFWADLPGNFDDADTNGGVIPDNPDPFNPRLIYDTNYDADPANDRWVFVCAAETSSVGRQWSALLVAVSRTADPAGDWDRYRLDVDAPDGQQLWADAPNLGFNGRWVVASVNLFDLGNDRFSRSQIYVLDKQPLYNGALGQVARFDDAPAGPSDPPASPSYVPALTYDPDQSRLFLVQNWNETSGRLRVSTITGGTQAPVLTPGVAFPQALEGGWSFQPRNRVDLAPQRGTTRRIQTGDARLQSVVCRNGSLWCAQTVFLPAGGNPTRASVRWVELEGAGADPFGITTRQEFRIDDPDATRFFAYPSIAVNADNDLLLGYSQFTGQDSASAGYAFKAGSDPPSTLRAATLLKAGETRYVRPGTGTRNRWGNYSTTVVDPRDDRALWTLQPFAASPANRWGTWWGQIVVPPQPGTYQVPEGFTSSVLTSTGLDAPVNLVVAPASFGSYGGNLFVANRRGSDTPNEDFISRIPTSGADRGVAYRFADVGASDPRGMVFNSSSTLLIGTNDTAPFDGAGKVLQLTPGGALSMFSNVGFSSPGGGLAQDGIYGGYGSGNILVGIGDYDAIGRIDGLGQDATIFSDLGRVNGGPNTLFFGSWGSPLGPGMYMAVDSYDASVRLPGIYRVLLDGQVAPFATSATSALIGPDTQGGVISRGGAFGRELYFTNASEGTILRATSDGQVSLFASGFNHPTAVEFADTNTLYVAEYGANRIVEIRAPSVVQDIAFVSTGEGTWNVHSVNPDGGNRTNLTSNFDGFDLSPTWSRDGSRIAFTRQRGSSDIYVMSGDGTGITPLTTTGWNIKGRRCWSPNSAQLVFTKRSWYYAGPDIAVINADGTGETLLTSTENNSEPVWSPNRAEILFTSTRDGNAEVYKMNADGTGQRRLTNNLAPDTNPQWSPDGTRIAFTSLRDSNAEVYAMSADGTNLRRLTNNIAPDTNPQWSPDGTKIAFESGRAGEYHVYKMNADGTNQARLTNHPAQEIDPVWSPDGSKIVLLRSNYALIAVNIDGAGELQLTFGYGVDSEPDWRPR